MFKSKIGVVYAATYLEAFIGTMFSSSNLITNKEAHNNSASLFTINAGFFDPNNQKTISYIVNDYQTVDDPVFNENLMSNPVLRRNLKNILKIKLDELKRLCDLNYVSKADQERMKKLISEFDGMPNLGSSMLLAEYRQLLLSKSLRLKELGVL